MRHAKKALRHKGFLLFLTPSALSAAASEYQAVANDRVIPDSGHDGSHFGRLLNGKNVPEADAHWASWKTAAVDLKWAPGLADYDRLCPLAT
jgi:hypothetical protein